MSSYKRVDLGPRNDPIGLMRRSMENYRIVKQSFQARGDGHVVTQLVQSLFTIIIFPKERELFERFRRWRLEDLNKRWGLPRPVQDDKNDTDTLFQLLRHMRNALCHGLVTFYGEGKDGPDSRYVREIVVVFQDRSSPSAPIDWELRMTGDDIERLIDCITEIIF